MNQKQIFTEYWKVLNDFEDKIHGNFRIERKNSPQFKMSLINKKPNSPMECRNCTLHENGPLRNFVKGEGLKKLIIINRVQNFDSKGAKEPFTDEEKIFLSKWLEAIGLDLERDCKIIPLVFCSFSEDQHLNEEFVDQCSIFVNTHIDSTKSKAILLLGAENHKYFSQNGKTPNQYRQIPFFATHHPAEVLSDLSLKRPVWEALKGMKDIIGGN